MSISVFTTTPTSLSTNSLTVPRPPLQFPPRLPVFPAKKISLREFSLRPPPPPPPPPSAQIDEGIATARRGEAWEGREAKEPPLKRRQFAFSKHRGMEEKGSFKSPPPPPSPAPGHEGARRKRKEATRNLLSPPPENEEELGGGGGGVGGKERRRGRKELKRRKGTCIKSGFFPSSPSHRGEWRIYCSCPAWQKGRAAAQHKKSQRKSFGACTSKVPAKVLRHYFYDFPPVIS